MEEDNAVFTITIQQISSEASYLISVENRPGRGIKYPLSGGNCQYVLKIANLKRVACIAFIPLLADTPKSQM